MTKIPFNVKYRPQIESGEYKVVTREDRPVEIRIWDLKGDFPIVGVYFDDKNNRETAVQVTAEGRCSIKPNDDYCDDFFVITDEPELLPKEFKVGDVIKEKRCTTCYEILEIYKDGSLFLDGDFTIPPSEIHNWELVNDSPKSK